MAASSHVTFFASLLASGGSFFGCCYDGFRFFRLDLRLQQRGQAINLFPVEIGFDPSAQECQNLTGRETGDQRDGDGHANADELGALGNGVADLIFRQWFCV